MNETSIDGQDVALPDLRIESHFKNARLYNALVEEFTGEAIARSEANGGRGRIPVLTVAAERCAVDKSHVYGFVNLTESPISHIAKEPRWKDSALRISERLGVDPGELFPLHLYEGQLSKPVVKELNSLAFLTLVQARNVPALLSPFGEVWNRERSALIEQALGTIPDRSADILRMRFGLDGKGEATIKEVADKWRISVARVQQIEARARRMLRHPMRGLKRLCED